MSQKCIVNPEESPASQENSTFPAVQMTHNQAFRTNTHKAPTNFEEAFMPGYFTDS